MVIFVAILMYGGKREMKKHKKGRKRTRLEGLGGRE
jgi:hypothetical protein